MNLGSREKNESFTYAQQQNKKKKNKTISTKLQNTIPIV